MRHCTPLTYTLPCADTDRNKQRHSHQRNANNRQPVCSCWWLFTTVVYIVTFPRSLTQKSKHKHTLLHTAPALNYVRFDTGCQKTQSRFLFSQQNPKWGTKFWHLDLERDNLRKAFHFSSSSSVFLTVCPKLCALTITRRGKRWIARDSGVKRNVTKLQSRRDSRYWILINPLVPVLSVAEVNSTQDHRHLPWHMHAQTSRRTSAHTHRRGLCYSPAELLSLRLMSSLCTRMSWKSSGEREKAETVRLDQLKD